MADQRITQLTALPQNGVAATDVLPIVDISAGETKKVTVQDLVAAGVDLLGAGDIDLGKLDQASTTKLGTAALADDAVTAAKLAHDSSISAATTAPVTDNFEGRGYYDTSTGNLQVFNGSAYQQVVMPTAGIGDLQVTTGKLAANAITTAKVDAAGLGTAAYADSSITTAKVADGAVTAAKIATDSITASQIAAGAIGTSELASAAATYAKIQDVSATDRLLGRSTAGAGSIEEITCTAAGRALLDDADAAAQRATLGLGTISTGNGTWTNGASFSGTSSGTNTGDQTITLTGDVTGTGTGSFATAITAGAVTATAIAANAVTTGKILDDAITAGKLADNSGVIVSAATPTGSGAFIGQQWINTNTGYEYTWTGSVWQRLQGIATVSFVESGPLAFAVAYPDDFSTEITVTYDVEPANTVWAGPTSGADASPAFRALTPADVPDATVSTKGIIVPGTGLTVSSGTLNHVDSVTAGTMSGVTFNASGHITAAVALVAGDIPVLDTAKITTGTFGTAFISDDSVTNAKLADYATAAIGETLPVANFIGEIFFNPLDKAFFLWDGNVWQPIGISAGAIVFGGTYDATVNEVASTTTEGAAIGLSIGDPLPAASSNNANYYVVVSEGGTGVAPAPTVALAPPDLLLSTGTNWLEIDVSSTYVAQSAANVAFTPAGQISAITVQAAIEEVSNECRNADNITSGTLVAARGGTGNSSYTKGDLLAASASTTLSKLAAGTNGYVLRANSATATGLEWSVDYVGTVTSVTGTAPIASSGGATPAISIAAATTSVSGAVQLSDSTSTTSSVLAATPTAVKSAYDLAALALPKAGGIITGALEIGATGSLIFEGGTDDSFETTLAVVNPTADRTITLPDVTGNVVTTGDTGTVTSTMILDGTILNADINASAAIVDTKLATIATALKVSNSATTATDANTASAIVARDASGNFTAGTITAALTGNASTVTTNANLTGDVTSVGNATSIATGVIVNADINASAAIAGSKIVAATTSVVGAVQLSDSTSTTSSVLAATPTAVKSAYDLANAAAKLNAAQSFTAQQRGTISALTDGATITADFSLANNFSVTLGGNRTLANPTNLTAGASGAIWITQDGTGSRTLAYGSQWDFTGGTAPTLSTAASAGDCLVYAVQSSTKITATLITNLS